MATTLTSGELRSSVSESFSQLVTIQEGDGADEHVHAHAGCRSLTRMTAATSPSPSCARYAVGVSNKVYSNKVYSNKGV
eukprot:scaffold55893_cov48-Phaeocystis_antarctica.AAC.1